MAEAETPAAAPAASATGIDPEGLRGCLEKLPDNLRELFILRHIEGLSYKELGKLRNASVTSVGERLWKARRLLRACLQTQDGTHGAALAER